MIVGFPDSIKTQRLELRQLEPTLENAQIVFDVLRHENPDDYKYNPTTAFDPALKKKQTNLPATVEDMLQTMQEKQIWLEGDSYNSPGVIYYIFNNDKLIGLRRIHYHVNMKTVQISENWLIASARGHGFAKESMDAIEKLAFVDMGANRITRQCDTLNTASANSIKSSGFNLDGIARQSIIRDDGSFGDNMMWSKLKSEYK